jgi:hypothetical protein
MIGSGDDVIPDMLTTINSSSLLRERNDTPARINNS